MDPRPVSIGIIGTAGRHEDGKRITSTFYQQMKAAVLGIVAPYTGQPITFVSGGAAVADHLAVQLFLAMPGTKLRLHLPAVFSRDRQMFEEVRGKMFEPGNVANYYHRQFWKQTGINSLPEIADALARGAEVVVTPGFKQRNTKVANDADVLIALTFGDGPNVKDGGTWDTMGKFLSRRTGTSFHVDLHTMNVFSPAQCPGLEIKPQQGTLEIE